VVPDICRKRQTRELQKLVVLINLEEFDQMLLGYVGALCNQAIECLNIKFGQDLKQLEQVLRMQARRQLVVAR